MECPRCGSQVNEGDFFCSNCNLPINNIQNDFNSKNKYNNTKKKQALNHKKIPTKLIIITIIIIITIFIAINIIKHNESYQKNNNSNNIEDIIVENENTNTVTYNGFNFKIPKELTSTPSEDGLLIINNDKSIAMVIKYDNSAEYTNYTQMKNSLINIFKKNNNNSVDFTSATIIEKKYNGTNFLITKDIKKGKSVAELTYVEANNGVFLVSLAKQNENITDSDRTLYYPIIASANNN